MAERRVSRKLAAILSADVVGYSKLMADDEATTVDTLKQYRAAVGRVVERHKGRIVNAPGDNILAEFASAVEAVQAAVEIQRSIEGRNVEIPDERRMHFRVGVNLGDVIEEDDGTIYGDGVNIAARMESLAEAGGICISSTIYDAVEGKLDFGFDFLGEQQVKNIVKPVRAYRVRGEPGAKSNTPTAGRTKKLGVVAAAALIAAATGVAWWYFTHDAAHPTSGQRQTQAQAQGVPRVAVLPLANISASEEDEYFSDGMTEELISRLSRVRGLDVIARTSVMQYKTTQKSIADIGRELNVGAVLEGSVRKAGDKVRITVQLIDVATQGHMWSEDFDRNLKDIFATQSEIAERVASAMHVKLAHSTNADQARTDPETYELYLKGLFHAAKLTPDGLKTSIGYFERALKKSPNDARSWAGLAKAYAMLGWHGFATPEESFQKGKVAAEHALAIDETLAEAHISLGMVRFLYDWDWPGAERAYQRAIELNPGSADAHLFYGIWLKAMAMNARAVAELRRANDLDPLYLMANAELGFVAYFGGRFDEAARNCRRTLEMDPNYLFAMLCVQMASAMRKNPEAIALGKKMLDLTGGDAYFLGKLGWAYGLQGNEEEARRMLGQLQDMLQTQSTSPDPIIYAYMGLGDRERTLEWMERAFAGRWSIVVWTKAGPEYDWLRDDARFQALLKKLKFDG
jgi:TolB-like protein/class 3 adenylate cyclase/Tfp pilus assembly protein PilF